MIKLVKFLIALVIVAALVYFAGFVKLGDMTLWEHLVGISRTDEAKGLKDEIGQKAREIKEDVASKVPALGEDDTDDDKKPREGSAKGEGEGEAAADKKDASPLSDLTEEDRQALIDLLKKKNK